MRVPKDLARVLPLDEQLFAGRFVIEAEAGVGGMGVVYRAFDQVRGERVALKILHQADPAALHRFDAEVRALAKLRHPAIVEYVAHGVDVEGDPYLAMEWVVGETLHARLREGVLAIADALILGARLAGALESAHAVGVLHRDIKPSNVLLPARNVREAKLADFGLALIGEGDEADSGDAVSGECIVGTPGYMAPEQARGSPELDGRADLFSLGCLLFRCVTGVEPFPGTAELSASAKVMLLEPPPLSELHPEAPVALSRLVANLLAKNPDERPVSARAVQKDLERMARAIRADLSAPPSEVRTLESAPEAYFGRYVLESSPAGAGDVFLARDPARNRHVALRVFGMVRNPEEIAQLLREARVVSGVNHPNIAPILDVGEHAGVAFVVREQVTGQCLRRFMGDATVTFAQRARWLLQVAQGLAAAHRAGVAHGDVRPDNIVVRGGDIKLLDFRFGFAAGDTRGDQYAWGVIAYELLTGCSLADGIDLDGIDLTIAHVIRRAVHENPEERFATMDDAHDAFQAAIERDPARRKAGRRHRAWAVALIGLAALLTGIFLPTCNREMAPVSSAADASEAVNGEESTRNPKARAHFDAAIRYWRGASSRIALLTLGDALDADPDFAAAHLYSAIMLVQDDVEAVQHYRAATIHRNQLSPRDRALLDAFATSVTVPRDLTATQEALTAALVRFPADWLLSSVLARVHLDKHENQKAIDVSDAALRHDPSLALALYQRAVAESDHDHDRASRSLDECLRISPQADSCLSWLMKFANHEGQCVEAEQYARTLLRLTNRPAGSWRWSLAGAIIAQGGTIESARDAYERVSFSKNDVDPMFDVLKGSFAEAQRTLDDKVAWDEGETDGGWHEYIVRYQFNMAKELNDVPRITRLAAQHLKRLDGWLLGNHMEGNILPRRMQYFVGTLSREAFEEHRQRWMKNEIPTKDYYGTKDVWFYGYADAAKTKEDFVDAYRAYREYETAPHRWGMATVRDDFALGHVSLLADDVDRAIPLLRRVANDCNVVQWAIEHTWAHLDLGMALEQTGDVSGACAAYDVVVQRWGKEPRSVSARTARARRAALHCAAQNTPRAVRPAPVPENDGTSRTVVPRDS
ncbi:protein kinase [Pendulispora rubella]|uniref:Protein kinase n=1 Tax=Pendulispora rubella TaxID=2741070 RepID=A0ABZ2KQH8_9BACT